MTAARGTLARGSTIDSACTAADYACTGQHCVTCADEGVPMTVLSADVASGLALCVTEDGAMRTVEIGLVDRVALGVVVLVHADVAIAALGGRR